MISKKSQRDTNEDQLGDKPNTQQSDVSVKADNSPQACAMQRLVGHQNKPVRSV
jgi:hypothetical protein